MTKKSKSMNNSILMSALLMMLIVCVSVQGYAGNDFYTFCSKFQTSGKDVSWCSKIPTYFSSSLAAATFDPATLSRMCCLGYVFVDVKPGKNWLNNVSTNYLMFMMYGNKKTMSAIGDHVKMCHRERSLTERDFAYWNGAGNRRVCTRPR